MRFLGQRLFDGREEGIDPRVDPMVPAADAFLAIQRGRVPVVNGIAKLTFAKPFDVGVIPILDVTLEAPADRGYSYSVTSVDNTQATVSIVATTGLAINVSLGNLTLFAAANVPGSAFCHIRAERP